MFRIIFVFQGFFLSHLSFDTIVEHWLLNLEFLIKSQNHGFLLSYSLRHVDESVKNLQSSAFSVHFQTKSNLVCWLILDIEGNFTTENRVWVFLGVDNYFVKFLLHACTPYILVIVFISLTCFPSFEICSDFCRCDGWAIAFVEVECGEKVGCCNDFNGNDCFFEKFWLFVIHGLKSVKLLYFTSE